MCNIILFFMCELKKSLVKAQMCNITCEITNMHIGTRIVNYGTGTQNLFNFQILGLFSYWDSNRRLPKAKGYGTSPI